MNIPSKERPASQGGSWVITRDGITYIPLLAAGKFDRKLTAAGTLLTSIPSISPSASGIAYNTAREKPVRNFFALCAPSAALTLWGHRYADTTTPSMLVENAAANDGFIVKYLEGKPCIPFEKPPTADIVTAITAMSAIHTRMSFMTAPRVAPLKPLV